MMSININHKIALMLMMLFCMHTSMADDSPDDSGMSCEQVSNVMQEYIGESKLSEDTYAISNNFHHVCKIKGKIQRKIWEKLAKDAFVYVKTCRDGEPINKTVGSDYFTSEHPTLVKSINDIESHYCRRLFPLADNRNVFERLRQARIWRETERFCAVVSDKYFADAGYAAKIGMKLWNMNEEFLAEGESLCNRFREGKTSHDDIRYYAQQFGQKYKSKYDDPIERIFMLKGVLKHILPSKK